MEPKLLVGGSCVSIKTKGVVVQVKYARGFDEDTEDGRHLAAKLLAGEADQIGTRDHGDVGEDEDGEVVVGEGIADGDGDGDKGPEDVDGGGGLARGAGGDAEEVQEVDAAAARLARGLDAAGQGRVAVAVVVFVLDGLVVGQRRVLRGGRGGLFGGGHGGACVPTLI